MKWSFPRIWKKNATQIMILIPYYIWAENNKKNRQKFIRVYKQPNMLHSKSIGQFQNILVLRVIEKKSNVMIQLEKVI